MLCVFLLLFKCWNFEGFFQANAYQPITSQKIYTVYCKRDILLFVAVVSKNSYLQRKLFAVQAGANNPVCISPFD